MGTVLHHLWLSSSIGESSVSVPFSMGTVLHQSSHHGRAHRLATFQSPSRWGRCCITALLRCGICANACFSPLLDGDGVASRTPWRFRAASSCFSPLLDGDGVASSTSSRRSSYMRAVSVPFSMGTVLHRLLYWPPVGGLACFSPLLDGDGVASMTVAPCLFHTGSFSPLLDGDGVASCASRHDASGETLVSVPFSMGTVLHHARDRQDRLRRASFSPLLDGDGVASRGAGRHSNRAFHVSVPFSMGTVLHRILPLYIDRALRFQSPSRWGRCCIEWLPCHQRASLVVSVPFSMGTVLHRRAVKNGASQIGQVSVPFSMGTVLHRHQQ